MRLIPALTLLAACGGKDECEPYHWDADGDGYPVLARTCDPPEGATQGVPDGELDCNDESEIIYPDASDGDEGCDGLDNDCDGEVDEHETTARWYADADGDGYGDEAVVTERSTCEAQPADTTAEAGDCDDSAEAGAAVYPGASERCSDGVDQDCDGADAACALFQTTTLTALGAVEFAEGTAVAALGDATGDGLADFAVGYAGSDAVEIYAGGSAGPTLSGALSGEAGSAFGASLAAGDFDGDGAMDLAVGAPLLGQGRATVHLALAATASATVVAGTTRTYNYEVGAALATLPGTLVGLAVAYSDDYDGVGRKVAILDSPSEGGETATGDLGEYETADEDDGTAIWPLSLSSAAIDAEPRLAVGFSGGAGALGPGIAIYDTTGTLTLKLADSPSSTSALGASVAIGELDGHTIVAAGAPDAYDGDGAVYLLEDPTGSSYSVYDWDPGSSSGDDAERASWSCEAGAGLGVGSALGIVGDVEGDGDGELAIGGQGTLWLVAPGDSGLATGDLPDRAAGTISGFDGAVTAVINAGDVDGDGSEDLLVVDARSAWLLRGGRAL